MGGGRVERTGLTGCGDSDLIARAAWDGALERAGVQACRRRAGVHMRGGACSFSVAERTFMQRTRTSAYSSSPDVHD